MSRDPVASPPVVVVEAALTALARRRRWPLTGRDLQTLARTAVAAMPAPVPVVPLGRPAGRGPSWTWKPRTDPGAAREVAARLEASFAGPWPPVGRQGRDETTEPAGPH